jgi:hypothetical protein
MPATYSVCPGCTTGSFPQFARDRSRKKVDECLFVFLRRKKLFPVGFSSALYYMKYFNGGRHF